MGFSGTLGEGLWRYVLSSFSRVQLSVQHMRRSGKFNFVEWPASAQTSVSCFVLRTGINLNLISLNVYLYILNVWIGCYLELSIKNNID